LHSLSIWRHVVIQEIALSLILIGRIQFALRSIYPMVFVPRCGTAPDMGQGLYHCRGNHRCKIGDFKSPESENDKTLDME
jgi:hypothetical protein